MLRWARSSLPVRAGLVVALIAFLALTSALSAGVIAWLSEDDAAAINTAGSLRMATYRLTWKLEADAATDKINALRDNLEKRLNSEDLTRVLESDPQAPLHSAYLVLQTRWQNELRPALVARDYLHFQHNADDFVEQLDHFVLLMQRHSERKQSWQQSIQGAALFITVVILLVAMYELQSNVITPLQELVSAAERFRAGDHSARVEFVSEDELGQMANSFNAMAATIEESHRTLESRVAAKTAYLESANAALSLLYRSSRALASEPASANRLDQLLNDFQQRLPGLSLSLCLHNAEEQGSSQVLIALHGSQVRDVCARSDCNSCERQHQHNQHNFLISNQGRDLGELRARFTDGHQPKALEVELIQALADLVGTALSLQRQREQDHRLLLLEERAVIARELHDSLAQALSYMKLQTSRLQVLVKRGSDQAALTEVSDEIREGLNNAYRQLRELLTTFRLQIPGNDIVQALHDTAGEFAERGDLAIHLDVPGIAFSLNANEQIHVLQITREALSNCVRHAQANEVWLSLHHDTDSITLSIADNGVGLSGDVDQRLHHGLNIMQERARSLHGELHIGPHSPRGTQVTLRFHPEFLKPVQESVA
ncbi:histidine kinase [Atopomonas sediminilitoris]|uniref:histidine kinase n=1 Tax=Atopomonas sediminilitoris TaxID=2919919 RepID=UPI001F4D55A1|nr:histidine kinase [Atopomonas sediminilitoris]MCJ8169144.1 histidine kinase [Atopomonas sediminilitoris]